MSPRIHDHAIIGNGRSAALVTRDGTIDWLCWPRFDSSAVFASLLDSERGGSFRIAPAGEFTTSRRYVDDTNVLETRFETPSGTAILVDAMPLAEIIRGAQPAPEHELLRRIECIRGHVPLRVVFEPRPSFGRASALLRDRKRFGIAFECGHAAVTLQSETPLELDANGRARCEVVLRAGDAIRFSLRYASESPAVFSPLGTAADAALLDTIAWWRSWAAHAHYDGPHRDAVVRSALALKLLVYAPSGAVIAAPTASLPERPRGDLNWDYRFCWLRDASLTTRALLELGYQDEARAFVSWLLHATRLTRPALRIVYDVFGENVPAERVLPWLRGYLGSRPVRIGNAARDQLQLDVYGEVIDAVARTCEPSDRLDRETSAMLRDFGRYVSANWRRPDEGIWEPREPRTAHVHSRVLCWVALDRLVTLHRRGALRGARSLFAAFASHRDAIRDEIVTRGWNEHIQSYASALGGERVDAALLLASWYGFEDASSKRMRSTFARIHADLGAGPGLVYRYPESRDAGEGAFGICSFWAVEQLARGGGSLADACEWFENVLRYRNDVGLFAEEIDPVTGDALGNFPQAFTHVGLINAAVSISERIERERRHPVFAAGGVR
jgi:GH15 family glucan-1,4-alpha-glucosidase